MIKKIIILYTIIFAVTKSNVCFAVDDNIKSTSEILDLYNATQQTPCASKIFADALYANADKIPEDTPEYLARAWAKQVMQSPEVLIDVLQCPELNIPNTQTIVFTPVVYEFPNGRTLTINYTTQPNTIKQHIMLASKRSLPNDDVSPDLLNTDPEKFGKYMNTEPAWYAIMVVQHDALSEFVGPNKNNTLSLKYINDNIDKIYPHGYFCTSKSAITNDSDNINIAVRNTVDLGDDDSNDYYVAGDVNLGWVMYAEIALDVIITVATAGLGEAAMVAVKSANAARASDKIIKTLKSLRGMDTVKDYISTSRKIATHTDNIAKLTKNADDYARLLKNIEKANKAGKLDDAKKYGQEARKLLDETKKIDPDVTVDMLRDTNKMSDHLKTTKETIQKLTEHSDELVKKHKEITKYKETAEAFQDLVKYRRELLAFKRPQTGNVIVRSFKTLFASQKGADKIAKASKLARAGMSTKSAKIGDWLFEATLKHGARLARFERDVGLIYGAVSFLGEMYDYTSDTSKEFSNGIEFKPLCLLSADDLNGYENVVNYGMWLLWQGNSTDPSDDDAAYLQAMDFAEKFAYNLNKLQEDENAHCNVDIYVVRPIIRLDETNPNEPSGELFYLFMNDIPWTTAESFSDKITDIQQWNQQQQELYNQNPIKARGYKLPSEMQTTETENNDAQNDNTATE